MALLKISNRNPDPARTPNTLARHLFQLYEQYRVHHLTPQNCLHAPIASYIRDEVADDGGPFRVEEAGKSLEGRGISLVTCGTGPTPILFWSQMHGDEYTATLALMDVFNFLKHRAGQERWIGEMFEQVTLHFLPMLNPDGAQQRQRRTALLVDMNRDALDLATPEANILRGLQQRLKPAFGFNLHDQELAAVGDTGEVAAISLLAPPLDAKRSVPRVRLRAMRLASLIAHILSQFIPRNIGTYPDTFEPRAFGENMQQWGTSTVLIESGHWPSDPDKNFIRKLNFVALLAAARCIGNYSYQDVGLEYYRGLVENGKMIFDYILQDVVIEHPNGWARSVDIGLSVPANSTQRPPTVIIKDIGDLSTCAALAYIPGNGTRVSTQTLNIEERIELPALLQLLRLPAG